MPASRSVVSTLLRELGDFSLHPQGRPCGRPEAALRPGSDTTLTGEPASPLTHSGPAGSADRQGQRAEHVVLVRPPTDEHGERNTLYSQEMSTISVVTNHAIRHSCASRINTKADQVQARPP